jgi:hypothetical protein
MSIFRVNKSKEYTIMSNYHLKEKNMSLKAKGLLSLMLSLPEDWDYSIKGLAKLSKDNECSVETGLKELKEFGYLRVIKLMANETDTGRIEYIYDIYEKPVDKTDIEFLGVEKLGVEFLGVEFLGVENHTLNKYTNNKILNNKKLNNKRKYIKEKYGTYGRILLTSDEYLKLVNEFGEDFIKKQIELLDEYVESNDNKNKYKNFNLVIRKSIRENWFNQKKEPKGNSFLDIMKCERDKYDN